MRVILLITTLLISSFAPPEAAVHQLRYRVKQDGKDIGEIRATRKFQDNRTFYDVETRLNVKMLGSQKVEYYLKAVYQNGMLLSSTAKSFLNEKLHHTCQTSLKNNRYEIRRDKESHTLSRALNYSGVMLYFQEPLNVHIVYSEMSGQDNFIRKASEGHYLMTDGKSKKQNRYWYRNGQLEKAFIKHTFVDLELVRAH